MISRVKIITVFFFLLILLAPLNAQWKKTGSLLTGTITKVDYVYCLMQASLSQGGSTTYYQYAGTDAGVYISTNYGTNWIIKKTGLSTQDPSVLSIKQWTNNQGIFYAGGYGGFYGSDNWGLNWTSKASYDNGFTVPSVNSVVINGFNILASTMSSGVFRSTDSGGSWVQVNNGLTSSSSTLPQINSMILHSYQQNVYIYLAAGNGVYLTRDYGNTWYKKSSGFPTGTIINSLAANGPVILAATSVGLYRSTNLGDSWSQVSGAPTTINTFTVYNSYIFCGTALGVYFSKDNGLNWGNVSTGMSYVDVISLGITGTYIMAGTYKDGIWRRPLSEMVQVTPPAAAETEKIPLGFELSQNYPNPFNPSTIIKYTIPSEAPYMSSLQHVTLKVYDVLGRDIATLVNESKSPGSYAVSFQAEKYYLPGGVYFYTLRSGNYSLTKKMVLMK
jgi:hypothetical protein